MSVMTIHIWYILQFYWILVTEVKEFQQFNGLRVFIFITLHDLIIVLFLLHLDI